MESNYSDVPDIQSTAWAACPPVFGHPVMQRRWAHHIPRQRVELARILHHVWSRTAGSAGIRNSNNQNNNIYIYMHIEEEAEQQQQQQQQQQQVKKEANIPTTTTTPTITVTRFIRRGCLNGYHHRCDINVEGIEGFSGVSCFLSVRHV